MMLNFPLISQNIIQKQNVLQNTCKTNKNLSFNGDVWIRNRQTPQIDYKNNPKEREYDKNLGTQIQNIKTQIAIWEEQAKLETDNNLLVNINNQIANFKQQKENYKEELFNRNYPFVIKFCIEKGFSSRQSNTIYSIDDAIISASLGLLDAIETWDPVSNPTTSLITYSKFRMFSYVRADYLNAKSQIRIPRNNVLKIKNIKKAQNEIQLKTGKEATLTELSEATGYKIKNIKNLLLDASIEEKSLNNTTDNLTNKNLNRASLVQDFIADGKPNMADLMEKRDDLTYMKSLIANLSPMKQDILKQRILSSTPVPLFVLAEKYNITSERIRQIEKDTISTLRKIYRKTEA